jgi:hypothetical protein
MSFGGKIMRRGREKLRNVKEKGEKTNDKRELKLKGKIIKM